MAGWLQVKNMLVNRRKRVERATKRKWKKYWVCLKGTTLLLFACDEWVTLGQGSKPRHVVLIEGSIAQAVPEHPKKDNIFCLSTAFGDAYFFQALGQMEMENWITALHSACSSAFARQHGKDDTVRLLKKEAEILEQQIDMDGKMKKMAELQLTVISDPKSKNAINNQINQWEQNLEKLQIEMYRLRCYQASLQGTELPNPKTLLSCASKATKASLARLGYFTVSSFHAMVSARHPAASSLPGKYKNKKKKLLGNLGNLRIEGGLGGTLRAKKHSTRLSLPRKSSEAEQIDYSRQDENWIDGCHTGEQDSGSLEELDQTLNGGTKEGSLVRVMLPDNQSTAVLVKAKMSIQDLLVSCCVKRQMDYNNYYVRLRERTKEGLIKHAIPDKSTLMENLDYEELEICAKSIHQIELYKYSDDPNMTFGFKFEAELGEDSEQEDQLCLFVSEVEPNGLAYNQDIQVGDEILVVNSQVVCDLDTLYIEELMEDSALTLTIRSCRIIYPQTQAMMNTNQIIDQLTCPPPPSQTRITDETLGGLIVPAPSVFDSSNSSEKSSEVGSIHLESVSEEPEPSTEKISQLLQRSEQLTAFVRTLHVRQSFRSPRHKARRQSTPRELSTAQKLRKVIMELVETERAYVKDLKCLMTRYLEPLQNETFLTADELEALFGNIKEILQFQCDFLQGLEEALSFESDFKSLDSPAQFRNILFSVGGSFLFCVDHFKLYSTFCASYSKSQKILDPAKGNMALKEFMDARNPKHQHSSSLGSYLIKPIQRVMKYPLLLKEMKSLTVEDSDEYSHLSEALRGMEQVAEHINDMKRVHEEFGDVFDSLVADQYHLKKEVTDLPMDDLLFYDLVTWFNAQDDLGKIKKGMEPPMNVFVFRWAIVLVCKEKNKKKGNSLKPALTSPTNKSNPEIQDEVLRFKRMIPTSALQITASTTNDNENRYLWELIHTKSTTDGRPEKVFQLSCRTPDLRNTFLKHIRQTLKDYNKTKSLPAGAKLQFNKVKTYASYKTRSKSLQSPTSPPTDDNETALDLRALPSHFQFLSPDDNDNEVKSEDNLSDYDNNSTTVFTYEDNSRAVTAAAAAPSGQIFYAGHQLTPDYSQGGGVNDGSEPAAALAFIQQLEPPPQTYQSGEQNVSYTSNNSSNMSYENFFCDEEYTEC